ncbi:MAG: chloride channel protein [Nannocystaceae bacterium]
MAQTHFKNLDEESRALHDSWDHIARIVILVALLTVMVWGACSLLRWSVHLAFEALLHTTTREGSGLVGPVTLLLVLTIAGVVRGLLMRRPAWQEAAGDGVDQALENYHITYRAEGDDPQPRYDRPAFALAGRKGLTTFLTLGTGGSGGLEAPVVLISECLAAGFSRVMNIRSEYELRTYQLAAIAAAVATLLGAPFTAALFAAEIAYGDRIIYRKLAYGIFAGVIAYWLNNRIHGYAPLFVGPDHAATYSLSEYAAAALVAVAVSVPIALGFSMAMTRLRDLVGKIRPIYHAPVTSFGVGACALVFWYAFGLRPEHVLGMGEATITAILTDDPTLGVWWVLALALVGKVLTLGLTLGGGGSAGMLVPSMVLGGVSGALMAHFINLSGLATLDPALFAVVGIGSSLVAVIGVPLAAIALVLEVFGRSYGPPALLACGVTYLLTLKIKIYKAQRMSPDPAIDETG